MVETYDTGCTPGGGKDGISVFYDAGLLFESNTASGTSYRQDLRCPPPSRRKRSTPTMDVTSSLASQYEDQLQRDCCLDGIRTIPISYTCERRSEYIMDGPDCVEAFLHCCKEIEKQRDERKQDSLQLARSEEDDSYMDTNEIVSRTKFPESWLWSEITLPACSDQTLNCDTTYVVKNIPLQDSITTWQFTGISLSRTHGICVAKPLEVIVKKDFFIELKLPYAAVRGEQLQVKAILYNYSPDPATVLVDLIEEIYVCSAASKHGRYRQQVKVGAQSTQSVPFVIIPTRLGQYRIEVKAAVKDSSVTDGVMKMLRVVPEGVLVKSPQIVALDPEKKGVDGRQVEMINSGIPTTNFAPNTPTSTQISVTGCGEENMIHMTLTVVATMYLDKTNQWEPVDTDRRDEALQHIKTGYLNELSYRKSHGSFAVFPDQHSSTWVTCWAQNSDASMTAFTLIAMQESRPLCAANVSSLSSSINKAVAYLEKRLPSLTNPYAVAMTSYALANENKLNQEILYKFASPELSHWQVPKGRVYTLEATAYALLALVKAGATLMVYQAVADYWSSNKGPEYDLNVDIQLPGRSKPDKYNFNNENQHTTRTSKVKDINKDVKVIATGKGEATLTMVSLYYALPIEKESDCQKFNLSVQLLPGFKDKDRDAAMTILDIGLLTGFTPNTNDLSLLAKGRARTISKYNMNTADSERGSLIIYLDKVSHTRPEEITFRVHQKLKVGVLQPAAVSVYEYNYQQSNQTQCMKFYHPQRKSGELLRLCRNDECTCAEGSNDVDPQDKLRTFLSYQHCRHALDLRQGHTYLIMGASRDIYRDDRGQSFQYVLGERTWIEYWPTEAECKTTKYKLTCAGIEDMVQQYRTHGCRQ
ncbi:Complement C3 [Nibea albiflora]|uniref:Complement C3 n=1 Tax=Nibea albiflora TaxID=240163 RepID=A0ACB7FLQ2_NIBAL|nr:Complement C3 [Nibea albiflora]